jgi:hypothetical protein
MELSVVMPILNEEETLEPLGQALNCARRAGNPVLG